MRCCFGLIALGLVLLGASGSEHIVKLQDELEDRSPNSRGHRIRTVPSCTCIPMKSCPVSGSSAVGNANPLQLLGNETWACCRNDGPRMFPYNASVEVVPLSGGFGSSSFPDDEELFSQSTSTAEDLHSHIVFADSISRYLGKEADRLAAEALRPQRPLSPCFTSSAKYAQWPQRPQSPCFASGAKYAQRPQRPRTSPRLQSGPAACIVPQLACSNSKYRTADGSCNNLKHTEWGKAHTAFQRLMPSTYEDGIKKPRMATSGKALPSARLVSTTIIKSHQVPLSDISLLFMTFGQFIDHDLTLTPIKMTDDNKRIPCCPATHEECMAIDIPADDPFYELFGRRCMEFVRTIASPPKPCEFGIQPREQLNQLTNYIDASMIYGSLHEKAEELRSKSGGKLLALEDSAPLEFPPHSGTESCKGDGKFHFCLTAGDRRIVEHPGLATIHIAFFREHNRIADELAKLNPHWNDEALYQETRRMIGAILQHIIYNEYLPIVLGDSIMQDYNLKVKQEGFADSYDPETDASILNEFATAAFRFGHSAVPSDIKLVNEINEERTQRLRDHFLKPYDTRLYNDYTRGFLVQSSEKIDHGLTPHLTNFLFQTNGCFGLDLAALNIQRGRDHAIGTYTQARKFCGLEEVKSFGDLFKFMDCNIACQLSHLYENVEDIDLWIGGVVENPLPGAAVGPTFACILVEQFKRTKIGDRFWYERGNTESSFNKDQLRQIRKTSLARILCDNSDISTVQPLALLKPMPSNLPVPCKQIPQMRLLPWRNEAVGELIW